MPDGHVETGNGANGHTPAFEQAWPLLARQVSAMLAQRAIPPSLRDDIVQETGLRLYRMWAQIDESRSVVGLARTIALNIARDNYRRDARQTFMEDVPDRPEPTDVERAGLARIELRRLGRALGTLTAAERNVVLEALYDRPTRVNASAGAVKMMRMRARKKLRAVLDRSAIIVPFHRRVALDQRLFSTREEMWRWEQGLALGLAGLVATVVLGGATLIPRRPAPPTPEGKTIVAMEEDGLVEVAAPAGEVVDHDAAATGLDARPIRYRPDRPRPLGARAPVPAAGGWAEAGAEVVVPVGLPGAHEGSNECLSGLEGCRKGRRIAARAWVELVLLDGLVRVRVEVDSRDARFAAGP